MNEKLKSFLNEKLAVMDSEGRLKGDEKVITGLLPEDARYGKKIMLKDGRPLINFASNSYLGISNDPRLIAAEHTASKEFGVGPGAVRFISGTQQPHVDLEQKLATFLNKNAAMIFSSAYAANCGIIAPLVDEDTMVISDRLNHNSIIMAIRLAGAAREKKKIYSHCDANDLERCLKESSGNARRVLIVTDGVFSMRGNYAPLKEITNLAASYSDAFEQGIVTIVDDSHGIGAFGENGKGTVEVCDAQDIDIITGTLGKALGVDGGFVVSDEVLIKYFRETSPFYIYSNPVSAGVASASIKALELLENDEGKKILQKLKENTEYFRNRIQDLGFNTIQGIHPIVPILIGDPIKARNVASILYDKGIYVVALTYPVVPRGQDTIRVQISSSHTGSDLDRALKCFSETGRKEGIIR